MKNGYFALLGTGGSFIAHPDQKKEGLTFEELYPDFSSEYQNMLKQGKSDGVIKIGRKMIGFSVTNAGWVLIAVPDSKEVYASVDRLIRITSYNVCYTKLLRRHSFPV